jgi:hypothetical protein
MQVNTKKYLINVAPIAIPKAVSPPGLLKVCLYSFTKLVWDGNPVVFAWLLNKTMSIGVTNNAIKELEATDAINKFIN